MDTGSVAVLFGDHSGDVFSFVVLLGKLMPK